MTTTLTGSTSPTPNPNPLPATFSPSSLLKFRKCPLEWKNSYLPKIETPGSVATVKGNLFHGALEDLWTLPPQKRTRSNAQQLVRDQWVAMRDSDTVVWSLVSDPNWVLTPDQAREITTHNNPLVSEAATQRLDLMEKGHVPDRKKATTEQGLLVAAAGLIENYFGLEDPTLGSSTINPPTSSSELLAVEMEARATFGGATFRGFIDRVEEAREGNYSFIITDYKTGKQKFDEKYLADYWWQQATYAVLLEEMFGVVTSQLRLVFPSGDGGGKKFPRGRIYVKNFDAQQSAFHKAELEATYRELYRCWETDTWPLVSPGKARLCDWCHFKDICPSPGGYTDFLAPL
jgi:putative RecB family exonuclease